MLEAVGRERALREQFVGSEEREENIWHELARLVGNGEGGEGGGGCNRVVGRERGQGGGLQRRAVMMITRHFLVA